jgi:formate hydrogenlyase transcriptional activator
MASTTQSPQLALNTKNSPNESGLFSSESVLNILKLILAGSPLSEVLAVIARLVESRGDGTLCTI